MTIDIQYYTIFRYTEIFLSFKNNFYFHENIKKKQ